MLAWVKKNMYGEYYPFCYLCYLGMNKGKNWTKKWLNFGWTPITEIKPAKLCLLSSILFDKIPNNMFLKNILNTPPPQAGEGKEKCKLNLSETNVWKREIENPFCENLIVFLSMNTRQAWERFLRWKSAEVS